ncbi:MAG: asparagine synthase (glutamine-hydrolyzing) [Candidatus Omnitrophica bacterium]|nr:asparagine synthase (glutamine-hydrolyzing) [Candidatus Omnitrophota bacterium]
MCGICGYNYEDPGLIKEMTDVIAHRGPDSDGCYIGHGFSIGNRRLSILDLSEKGDQPIFNEDRSKCVVYNGEIYNYPALKKELEQKGHTFYSTTDTEALMHAFEEWGHDCVHHFNGMFTFALLDLKTKELFIARDRIGIKPLYYYWDGKAFVFGSEIKSILKSDRVKKKVDHQSLYYYLGYEFVPGPRTMFENIYKLQPGHYLIFKDASFTIHQYWELSFEEKREKDENAYVEKLRDVIESAVRLRLLSDVPLGMFLSGGLDSSTILAFMRKHINTPIRTYSIGYPDKTYSELDYAELVARHFGAEHNVLMIEHITANDIEDTLWSLDEPMTDLSTIPYRMISKRARQDITVCLSGEGGDEIFLGYDRFKASKFYNNYYCLIPSFIRHKLIAPLIGALPDRPEKKGLVNIMKRFMEGAELPDHGYHMKWQYFMNERMERALFNKSIKDSVVMDGLDLVRKVAERCNSENRSAQESFIDVRFTMTDSILMKVDKMSMAYALEVRVPFLDHRVVECAASIPGDMKLKGFTTKYIFRKALEGLLPDKIVWRGKQGYSFPSKNWLREGLRDYMYETLRNSPLLKSVLDMNYLEHIMSEHISKRANYNHVLWALINLAVWHRRFF